MALFNSRLKMTTYRYESVSQGFARVLLGFRESLLKPQTKNPSISLALRPIDTKAPKALQPLSEKSFRGGGCRSEDDPGQSGHQGSGGLLAPPLCTPAANM